MATCFGIDIFNNYFVEEDMMHFIRPLWFLALIPWTLQVIFMYKRRKVSTVWEQICDPVLLRHMLQDNTSKQHVFIFCALSSILCMILALSGPSWSKRTINPYQILQSHVVLLDLSTAMQQDAQGLDKLQRAKFKLHDLLQEAHEGLFGLIAYTEEPFIVSPLTNDANTIDELLPSVVPNIMPLNGYNLKQALLLANNMIADSGAIAGDILIMTAHDPDEASIKVARKLNLKGYSISIMPFSTVKSTEFQALAAAGGGLVINYTNDSRDLSLWVNTFTHNKIYRKTQNNVFNIWKDQGLWFLIPALLLLLPLFMRGVLQQVKI